MRQKLCAFILRLFGWTIEHPEKLGKYPKMIVAVAPHTSNWDFPLGLLVRCASGYNVRYLGKNSLFKWPIGYIFSALGGFPVDRSGKHNLTDTVAHIFDEQDNFILSIAPEGTRKKVGILKSGFYFMAKKANVPILCAQLDGEKKCMRFGPFIFPGDNTQVDLSRIHDYFKGIEGINRGQGL
jgi:1-acyl-sn-glycerol-3-phosphate acyltransferase